MTDSVARQRSPVALNYPQPGRAAVVAALIHELTHESGSTTTRLSTKSVADPTVALLDAWATLADVIGFYQQRIATENYLTTATEPQSVLALAALLGYRPRPGLAATCWLAYTLVVDPTDTAVLIPKHQLVQSIPGPGELPQTFETTDDFVARPSWNTLPVQLTTPLQIPSSAGLYQVPRHLDVAGSVPPVKPNDVILITLSDQQDQRLAVRVDSATADVMAKKTTVTLQSPADVTTMKAPVTVLAAAGGGQPAPQGPDSPPPPPNLITRMADLFGNLTAAASTPPADETAIARHPALIFPGSDPTHRENADIPDMTTKLLAALHPGLSRALYPALASSTFGPSPVESVEALRATTAPFGVQIPPRARFDNHGNPLPPQEWPLGGTQSVKLMTAFQDNDNEMLHTFAEWQIRFDAPDHHAAATLAATTPLTDATGTFAQATVTDAHLELAPQVSGLDHVSVTIVDGVVTVKAADKSVTVAIDPTGGATAAVEGPLSVNVGVPLRITRREQEWLVIDIATALPVADQIDRTHLDLNDRRDDIVTGSYVMIESADHPPANSPQVVTLAPLANNASPEPPYPMVDPLVARVVSAAQVAVNRFGLTMTVTRLVLDSHWISPFARLLSDLRPLVVHAQSVPLQPLGATRTDAVLGSDIDLSGLYPGIGAGHRLVLSGARADLGDAVVQASETVMVSGVTQKTSPGSSPYTTLSLAKGGLSYHYRRETVTLYGNVVPAHHGTTISEPLTPGGDPNHPTFTLSQSPVLADPVSGASGFASSLVVVVDGRTWTWMPRLDDDTAPRCYLTGSDSQGRTTVTLGQPLPHAGSTVTATYRAGAGGAGNVRAGQLTQPLTRPLAVATVTNPVPASGGSDPDGPDAVRARAPLGLQGLGRVVSVADAADIALSWAGIGKTTATMVTAGGRDVVRVTVAGAAPTPIEQGSALIADVGDALTAAGDVTVPITVVPATVSLIVLVAQILHDPDLSWATVEPAVRAELAEAYGYDHRGIDEPVVFSDLIAVMHRVDGVRSATIVGIGTISYDAGPEVIAAFTPQSPDQLPRSSPTAPPPDRLDVSGVVYLSAAVADTLILQEA